MDQMSLDTDKSDFAKFSAPEFARVFTRIYEQQKEDGYYCLRALNKFHAAQFERSIKSARINISNLQSFVASKYAKQIQFLKVYVTDNFDANLDQLCYISPTYLPNIEKADVIFTDGDKYVRKEMWLSGPLVFGGVNIIHDVEENEDTKKGGCIEIFGPDDIEIINSNFEDIGLLIHDAKKISVQNSNFRNIRRMCGLSCLQTQNSITINNVQFSNCLQGLGISTCEFYENIVSVQKIYVKKCRYIGCYFKQVSELSLRDSEIVDCRTRIEMNETNATIQNCSITGFKNRSIQLFNSTTVNYRQLCIKKFDEIDEDFKTINSVDSTFEEIL